MKRFGEGRAKKFSKSIYECPGEIDILLFLHILSDQIGKIILKCL